MIPNDLASSSSTGNAAIVTSSVCFDVRLQHVSVVHAVKLVARQNQNMIDTGLLQVSQLLSDSIGSSLIPIGILIGLLSCKDVDESAVEQIEPIGLPNVSVPDWRN